MEAMDFVRDTADLESMRQTSMFNSLRTPWIARPIPRKSNKAEALHRHLDTQDPLSTWETSLSKRRRLVDSRETSSSSTCTKDAMLGWELPGKGDTDWELSGVARNDSKNLAQPINKHLSPRKSVLGTDSPATMLSTSFVQGTEGNAPSVGRRDVIQMPPSLDRVDGARVAEKRSAFREVTKRRHKIDGLISQSCASVTPLNARESSANEAKDGFKKLEAEPLPGAGKNVVTTRMPTVPAQDLCGFPPSMLSLHANNLQTYHLQEAFQASPFLPLKRHTQTDFLKFIPDANRLRNANPYKDKVASAATASHFGTIRKGAATEQLSPLSFPWQQPLVPTTNVLPLSSSVPNPQYDNWCAKCNASFRMTSDLVYHMRTQHRRSAEGTAVGKPSTISTDGLGGKRAEEKLKCERCGETFRERHHLTRHMTSHISDRD